MSFIRVSIILFLLIVGFLIIGNWQLFLGILLINTALIIPIKKN